MFGRDFVEELGESGVFPSPHWRNSEQLDKSSESSNSYSVQKVS